MNGFAEFTLPQMGQRPPSCPRLAASCMDDVTRPWDPNRWRSRPWSVKNRHWHFWQFKGGRLWIILGWIFTLWIHCMWWRNCSRSCCNRFQTFSITVPTASLQLDIVFTYFDRTVTNFANDGSFLTGSSGLTRRFGRLSVTRGWSRRSDRTHRQRRFTRRNLQ